jgi:hypothetical protein
MTTYSQDTVYGRKHQTELHLIYKIENGQLQAAGLFEAREDAEEELALINRNGAWKIADITCLGWGIVDGVVGRNSPLSENRPVVNEPFDDGLCSEIAES